MLLGVDYASVDEDAPPDWNRARDAGVRFAIIRGTYEKWADQTLHRDWAKARALGLDLGAYLFPVMETGHPGPEDQVAAFASSVHTAGALDDQATCFPPILDIEFPGGVSRTGRTRDQLMDWIRTAVQALKAEFGVWPILYTSGRVWNTNDVDCLNNPPAPDLIECPLWLAHYLWARKEPLQRDPGPDPVVPHPWGDADNWWMHQFQGDCTPFPGFSRTVDVSRFHVMYEGAKGARVEWVQRKLGMNGNAVAGVWNANMTAAVKSFQSAHGLDADGIIGPATFIALCWA